ncbi:MAG: HupE/UreJ family protein [Gemmatimonadetes bacterium]|nr:HupE/UreJ family protein [Gemmatimonadota bacterium]
MRQGQAFLALVAATLAAPAVASAHDVDVTSVARAFLDQIGPRRYLLSVVDRKVPPITSVEDVLPQGCAPLPAEAVGTRIVAGFAFECSSELTFDDVLTLPWPLAGVVVLARWTDGTDASAYFRGDGREVLVRMGDLRASAGTVGRLAERYFTLGVEHIVFGIDHLLFVLGLLLLVRGFWPLVKTVTAFTVAHSITLGLAALGYIPVHRAPVEAAIALSVVLLAREIVMGYRGRVHLVHRQPWLVAFAFGLLHGLGFAGALGAMGLRSSDIPLALLLFNGGVEAGQIAFITVLVILHQSLRKTTPMLSPRMEPLLGYSLGVVAMLWLLQRLPAVLGA